jgi:integrase
MKQTRKRNSLPKLRHHKASGRAFVALNGRYVYLGPWGDPKSEKAYQRTVGEWLAAGRKAPVAKQEITVCEVCNAYLQHAKELYRQLPKQIEMVHVVTNDIDGVYGDCRAVDFGPKSLRTMREKWIERKITRGVINRYCRLTVRVFRYAASQELIPVEVLHRLETVEGLRAGQSKARESEPVRPVTEADIEAIREYVPPTVWNAIQLQLLCACRPSELLQLRTTDLDRTKTVWSATLSKHKTMRTGKPRVLFFGPKAQEILKDILQRRPVGGFLIDPRDSMLERAEAEAKERDDEKDREDPGVNRNIGECYRVDSYRRCITRACEEATDAAREKNPKALQIKWTPNQLRHSAATRVRAEYGLEGAQVLLGHTHAKITEVYAEVDHAKAAAIMAKIG